MNRTAYPPEPWIIREVSFAPSMAARNESIFALANGHLGLRGNLEEGGNVVEGTYINGLYEETPIVYGEIAYGYAKNRQVMLNVADGKRIALFVGGEPLGMTSGTVLSHERILDMRQGTLTRTLRWRSPRGMEIELMTRRLVSFARPEVAAIDYSARCLTGSIRLRVVSGIDASVKNVASGDDPRIGSHLPPGSLALIHREIVPAGRESPGFKAGALCLVVQETARTGFQVACAMAHEVAGRGRAVEALTETGAEAVLEVHGSSLRTTKYLSYCTSRDHPKEELVGRAKEAALRAREAGFDALLAEQRDYLDRFWAQSDVAIDGNEGVQQSVRFALFSLIQSAGRDGRTSIAAKGLTGEGYEGHYFWDTEIYVLPVFIYTQPALARALLRFRISILDQARTRAMVMSQKGVLFPWRTIGGQECSPYYPAGTAQYHIDADIAYALRKYVEVTGDESILLEGGAQLLLETARMWADLGSFLPDPDGLSRRASAPLPAESEFSINEVTGPDEYTALVNNNLYTNLMAKENLQYAAEVWGWLKEKAAGEWTRLERELSLEEDEVAFWKRAAARMKIPRDTRLGIHAQDDSFLSRARWDFARTPTESYPLLLHYHPLVIYRYQVLKQPDVVLAQVLLPRRFSMAEKKRNFDYYDPLTTGDSSLSPCIQGVAAAELGYADKAYEYFMRTARMDLDDVNGNVATGVHTAAMAGSWVSLVYGFAGMRDAGGSISFNPRLPVQWKSLRIRLRVHGALLEVKITRKKASYRLLEGGSLSILHRGAPLEITPGSGVEAVLAPRLTCVIFDLDGVITSTAECHFRAWKRLADELRLPFDSAVNERLKGVGRTESFRIILKNAGRDLPEDEILRLADRKNGYYRELISAITPKDLLPGMGDLLKHMRAEGIRTAIASVSRSVWEVVKRLETGEMVDHVVDPCSLVKGKPDPEVFFRAAENLGVPFEDCAGIVDSQAGIDAIRAAGMFGVAVGESLQGADWRVSDTGKITLEALRERFRAARAV